MMKLFALLAPALFVCHLMTITALAQPPRPAAGAKRAAAGAAQPKAAPLTDEGMKARMEAARQLAPEASVRELESLLKNNARSPLRARMLELLTAARAALGDERLRAGDVAGGVKVFQEAVAQAPAEMPDKLYVDVVSQLPANLFLRGHANEALQLARAVEERVKSNPQRLLAVAAFYLSVEQPEEAERVARAILTLAPDTAAAHAALGAAQRISLRLDEATASYRRAAELDPRSVSARRALADLLRAAGKPEEALTRYRELLTAGPTDPGARAGLVLSLFDANQREEAERELDAALKDDPRNLSLLVGAAWWYVTRGGDAARAQQFAARAVEVEPRYTWAQIALARSLVAQRRPLEAEGALRVARQYGRFPTLDYELANALAASGYYEEAAEELARSFELKDGQLETRLAGRTPARAASFAELLAPERRASIFQSATPDTEAQAAMLKGLLTLHLNAKGAAPAADGDAGAADAFVNGDDDMRPFRQLFAAGRLLKRGGSTGEARQLVEGAMAKVDASLAAPHATTALLADELRDMRARAIGQGSLPAPPQLPRPVLSNIMRGRIEDLAGWALFLEGKHAEASVRLRRAVSVLPENSPWWRDALWHLGAALDASGDGEGALAAYFRGFDRRSPDPARRAVIEGVYKRVRGSLEGFEARLNSPASAVALNRATTAVAATPEPAITPTAPEVVTTPSPAPETTKRDPGTERATATTTVIPVEPAPTATPTGEGDKVTASPTPERSEDVTAKPTPAPEATAATDTATTTATEPRPVNDSQSTNRVRGLHRAAATTTTGGNPNATCALSFSPESITLARGGATVITLNFAEREEGVPRPEVKASTPNWSDIVLLAEERAADDAGAQTLRFKVTSVGKKPGLFTLNFATPCGDKNVAVTVN